MKELQIAGWIWFVFFLFIAVISFVDAVTISSNESKTLIHFPYHVWKVGQAIWWLLLSFIGLFTAILSIIAEELKNAGGIKEKKKIKKEKSPEQGEQEKISLEKKLETTGVYDIKILDTFVFLNNGISILEKLGFSRSKAQEICENTPFIIKTNVPRVKAKEICKKLKEGFEIDVVPSIPIKGNLKQMEEISIFCPYCGEKTVTNIKQCPKCKAELTKIFEESEYECETCGSDVPEDANYCPKCGKSLED